MLLIVAEKPNQAADIARAILVPSSMRRETNCFKGRDYQHNRETMIGFCAGHLLELWKPEDYDPAKWTQWTYESLPIKPPGMVFRFNERDKTAASLLETLGRAMHVASEIINACDAGREGELIFWETCRYLMGNPQGKPISRMWIQNPTATGLKRSFEDRKSATSEKLVNLRDAALLRQQADWLYGFNMSRYVTLALPPHPLFRLQNQRHAIGRVQTAVLGLIYDRHYQVQAFQSEPFYRIHLTFKGEDEVFKAQLLADDDERFGKTNTMWKDYETVKERSSEIHFNADEWIAVDEVRVAHEFPPEPFSLVELQRTCWRVLGWHSKYTLKVAQACYASEQTITYPRTESIHLPLSSRNELIALRHSLWKGYILPQYPGAERLPVFIFGDHHFREDKDMEEHHAIVPTGRIPDRLDEQGNVKHTFLLWDLIVRRFVTALLPPAEVQASTRILEFYAGAKVHRALLMAAPLTVPSWLLVEDVIGNTRGYGMSLAEREAIRFPHCGPLANLFRVEHSKSYTERPDRFNDDTLLGAMMRQKLGTAATRADMIDKLIGRDYLERTPSGDLIPRALGEHLVTELRRLDAKDLLSPQVTATWERAFDDIETGKAAYECPQKFLDSLMAQIVEMGTRLHQRGSAVDATVYCPASHLPITEEKSYFVFPGYRKVSFPRIFAGREMSARDWRDVLTSNPKLGGGPFPGFKGKNGAFAAAIAFSARGNKRGQHFRFLFPRARDE